MNWKQIWTVWAPAMLLACFLALDLKLLTPGIEAREPIDTQLDPSWVDRRVAAWQPTKAERAFDEIGWVRTLEEAELLAQKHQRPVFLFTYDGSDLACFRC